MKDIGDIRMPANSNSYCYVRYHSFTSTFNALKFNKRSFFGKTISIAPSSYRIFHFDDIKYKLLCSEIRVSNIIVPSSSTNLNRLRTDIIVWLHNPLSVEMRTDINYTDRW